MVITRKINGEKFSIKLTDGELRQSHIEWEEAAMREDILSIAEEYNHEFSKTEIDSLMADYRQWLDFDESRSEAIENIIEYHLLDAGITPKKRRVA